MSNSIITEQTECVQFNPSEDIEQGTIIKFINNSVDKRYGIIVTGDCDIAQGKFGEYLSFCYIIPLDLYVNQYFLPKLVNKKIEKKIADIYKQITQIEELKNLSRDALTHLIESDETVLDLISNQNIKEQIKKLQDSKRLSTKECAKKICSINEKNLPDMIAQFPGDKFYINRLPDPDNNETGFVINLRRISEIEKESIATKIEPNRPFKCVAIGNLVSPYKQKMAQLLGAVFSDIGLPENYEQERDLIIENYSKELLK